MNRADFDTYKTPLGLKSPAEITTAAERGRLIRGSSLPRPGRATLLLANGSTFSSFFSTDAPLTEGTGDATVQFGIAEGERTLSLTTAPPA